MGARKDGDDSAMSAELLHELHDTAHVLDVVDEGQDIALDLHASLFNPTTRDRALAFLQSTRYEDAAAKFRQLGTPSTGSAAS